MYSGTSKHNATRVLRIIHLQPRISRVEISKRLDLNKSTVSKIVGNLEKYGIVEAESLGEPGPEGGRRPIHLHINAHFGCIMGVEIQAETFCIVGIDLQGNIFFSHSEPLNTQSDNLVDSCVQVVTRFRPDLEEIGGRLIGIGIGLPGLVDPVDGTLHASRPLGVSEPVHFAEEIRNRLLFDVPILVDNDANCGCWGELTFRSSERPKNFLFVYGELRRCSVPVDNYRILSPGFGIVINGRVLHGPAFSAGEFRSIFSIPGSVNPFSITDEEATKFLRDEELRKKVIKELAVHVAFIVGTLNLERVIVGGPIDIFAEDMVLTITAKLENHFVYPVQTYCTVTASHLGDKAIAFGAAGMFLEFLFAVHSPAIEDSIPPHGVDLLVSHLELM